MQGKDPLPSTPMRVTVHTAAALSKVTTLSADVVPSQTTTRDRDHRPPAPVKALSGAPGELNRLDQPPAAAPTATVPPGAVYDSGDARVGRVAGNNVELAVGAGAGAEAAVERK